MWLSARNEASRLLLIRLFQQTTTGSEGDVLLLNPKTKFLSLPSNIPAVALGGTAVTRKRVVSRAVWWLLIVFVLFSSISVKAQSDQVGQWATLPTLPFFPVHAHLLPTGQVMIWPGDAGISGNNPRLWNPAGQNLTIPPPPGYDVFCSAHAFLADGRLFVAGGHIQNGVGLNKASLYNPSSNTWAAAPDMTGGRWYPTVTTLANGDALVVSGSIDNTVGVNRLPQVYDAAANAWRSLTSAQLSLDLYPMMFLAPNGKVFNAAPTQTTRYLDTSGTGTWSFVANRNFGSRDYGSAVMYADGKILVVGGGDPPTNTAEVIDLNQPSPTWRSVASMSIARRQLNATLLPDGTVLVTGGTSGTGFNNANTPVYPAELWDPATESWRTLASATVPRLYHSAAVLLPDGRVLSTGGNGYPTPEAFSPPYLFKGAPPTMSAVPSTIGYGQTFSVQTPVAASITKVTLIRITSVTHAFNQNQRLNVLSFTRPGSGTLDIVAPATSNVAPPGHYLLFLVNGNGVPSVGNVVMLAAAAPAATLTSLSPSSAAAGGPAFTLTVNGTGFVSGAQVRWNGAARTTTFVNSGQLTATIPASDIGVSGTRPVTVVNPGASASNALTFIITTTGGSPGLVAAYGFGEGAGSTTADASGNGNTGVIANATWTASGKFGSALVFNGSNALVTIAHAPELNLTTAMTLMAWVKPSVVTSAYRDVIWKDYFAYFLEATSDTGAPGVGAFINSTAHVWVPAPSALTVDAWAHLAATYDGQNVRLYVNGVQVGISAQTGTIGTTTTPLWIGGAQRFTGVIDEVRIYNVALTQAQIQADMNTSVGGGGTPDTQPPTAPSGLTATAAGATQINLNWTASTDTVGVTGYRVERCQGVTCANFVQIATPPGTSYADTGLAPSTPYRYQVRATDAAGNLSGYSNVASATTSTPAAATLTTLSPSSAAAGAPAFTLTVNGTGFASGAIVHWNGSPKTTTFVSSTQLTAAIPASDIGAAGTSQVTVVNPGAGASNALTFTITAAAPAATLTSLSPSSAAAGGGAFTLTVNGTGFVNGATVRWNGAARTTTFVSGSQLTAAIAASDIGVAGTRPVTVVNPGASASNALTFTITPAGGSPGLVAAYGFDEGTGPTTADLSGNGNTGVIANATWTASGKFGSALVFNGSNALVTIAHAPELNLTTAMTLMAWVKPSVVTSAYRDVIWKDYFAYFLEATSDTGAPGVGAFINSTAHVWVPAPSALTVDAWAHLAATYDGQNVRLYVNGVQVGISAQTGTIGTTTTPLWIGGAQRFTGVIDEVRIYNVALTQAQIQADMNTSVGGGGQMP